MVESRLCGPWGSLVHGDPRRALSSALEVKTGKVIYDIEMATVQDGFRRTPAHRSSSTTRSSSASRGRSSPIAGFIDAYEPTTGRAVAGASTRSRRPASRAATRGRATSGSAAAVRRGSPAPTIQTANLLYWGTATPTRIGTARVAPAPTSTTDSLVALEPDAGALRWHFQFTPHDTHDWDANEVPVLADLHDRRPRAQGRDDGESQRVLLRPGSADRRVSARQTVRESRPGRRRSGRTAVPACCRIRNPPMPAP